MQSAALAVLTLVAGSLAIAAQPSADARTDRIRTLENLPPIAIEARPDMGVQAMSETELRNAVKDALSRRAHDLSIVGSADKAEARAELSVVTAREGGRVQLAIYRPVRIAGVSEEVFAPVWSESRLILRGVNRAIIRESIDSLVATFAADYEEARKRRAQ
jgi:hypothetical protein